MLPWLWRLPSHQVALRNAQHASAVLAQRRREREEIEAYLAQHDRTRANIGSIGISA